MMVVLRALFGVLVCVSMLFATEAEELNGKALQYCAKGDYQNAVKYGQEALDKAVTAYDKNDDFVALLLHNLADYYTYVDRYDLSLELNKKALAAREKALSPKDKKIADSLVRLSSVLRKLGEYGDAEASLKRALSIYVLDRDTSYGENRELWMQFGRLYADLGEYDKGKKAYEKALRYASRVKGEELKAASIYDNLGNLSIYAGTVNEKTLYLYRKAQRIKMEYLGSEHLDVGVSYNNIGSYYYMVGKFELSEKNYLIGLKIREKALGANHSDVAQTLNNLGELYRKKRDYAKAVEYLKRATEIDISAYGEDNTEVATDMHNLSLVYYDMSDYKLAKEYGVRALKIREGRLPAEHPDIKASKKLLQFINEELDDVPVFEPVDDLEFEEE